MQQAQEVRSRSSSDERHGLVGSSDVMRELRARVRRYASFDEPVLVVGETGTGKELVSRALHAASPRREHPLQVVHCAGVGEDVLSSELFGHTAGAFTGARRDRPGRIRTANGSSLILDEISETSDAFQAAILRAIEYGEIQPLGRDAHTRVDVRFIATSNRPPDRLSQGDGMRRDLFHRLSALVIRVPALRDRRDDIPDLAEFFLQRLRERYGRESRFEDHALELLRVQPFPGNVRELKQVVLRAFVESEADGMIGPEGLTRALAPTATAGDEAEATPVALEEVIRRHIRRTLRATDGNLSQAARVLELPRSTLQHYLVKYRVEEIEEPRARSAGS